MALVYNLECLDEAWIGHMENNPKHIHSTWRYKYCNKQYNQQGAIKYHSDNMKW